MKKARLIKRSTLNQTPPTRTPQPQQEAVTRLSVARVKQWAHQQRSKPQPNACAAFAALFTQPQTS